MKKKEEPKTKNKNRANAQKGNSNGTKLKDPSIRQMAYEKFCEHLSKGKHYKSFFFEHEQFTCTGETLEKYSKDTVEFDPIKKEVALAKGFNRWETVVEDTADGKNKDANVAALQMLMRNKFSWDKKEQEKPDLTHLDDQFKSIAKSREE